MIRKVPRVSKVSQVPQACGTHGTRHSRGTLAFTLIEIMVVLAIGALVFIGGYAGYRDFTRRQILSGAQEELKSNLALARQFSLSGEKPGNICPGSTLEGYQVGFEAGCFQYGCTSYKIQAKCESGGPYEVRSILIPQGISISGLDTPVLFKVVGQGTDLSSDLTITLTQGSTGAQSTVTVTSAGTIN